MPLQFPVGSSAVLQKVLSLKLDSLPLPKNSSPRTNNFPKHKGNVSIDSARAGPQPVGLTKHPQRDEISGKATCVVSDIRTPNKQQVDKLLPKERYLRFLTEETRQY